MASSSDRIGARLLLALIVGLWAVPLGGGAQSAEIAPAQVTAAHPLPAPILDRLTTIIRETFARLDAEGALTAEQIAADPVAVAEQIQAGLSVVLEDRGYRVSALAFSAEEPIAPLVTLALAGAGVESVAIVLEPATRDAFWQDDYESRLDAVREQLKDELEPALIGLPLGAIDREWALALAVDPLEPPAWLRALYPAHTLDWEIAIGPEATVTLHLTAAAETVSLLRVEARSASLLMATLDPIEEVLLAHSALVVGMPLEEVAQRLPELECALAEFALTAPTARQFGVEEAEVELAFDRFDPSVLRAIAQVESSTWHLRAEAFVDLGNDRTPAEFQGFGGYRFSEYVEGFAVLNVLTEDFDVAPDLGLGLTNQRFFAGGAWDFAEGDWKYFGTWDPSPLFRFSVEGFWDSDVSQDQFGVLYQPTQQLGVGAFTDGEGLLWVRTSFRL